MSTVIHSAPELISFRETPSPQPEPQPDGRLWERLAKITTDQARHSLALTRAKFPRILPAASDEELVQGYRVTITVLERFFYRLEKPDRRYFIATHAERVDAARRRICAASDFIETLVLAAAIRLGCPYWLWDGRGTTPSLGLSDLSGVKFNYAPEYTPSGKIRFVPCTAPYETEAPLREPAVPSDDRPTPVTQSLWKQDACGRGTPAWPAPKCDCLAFQWDARLAAARVNFSLAPR